MSSKFKSIREEALINWLKGSKRTRDIDDNFSDSFECDWQVYFVPEDKHNSCFCSIGEWNSHITDVLSDESLDNLSFDIPEESKVLYRYYGRFFLIVSEVLTDFRQFLNHLDKTLNQQKISNLVSISDSEFTFSELFNFINNIFKHKFGDSDKKYHCLNHHVEYSFVDSSVYKYEENDVTIKTLNSISKDFNRLEIPKLNSIIDLVHNCYLVLNAKLNELEQLGELRSKLEKFEE